MPYFLHDRPLETGLTLPFAGEEAHHLLKSRRIRPGESFALQGPDGLRFEAELLSVERRAATVKIRGALPIPAQPRVRAVLLVAAVKDKAADWIVQKCAELGAAAIVFFPSHNAIVPRKALQATGAPARWEKIAWEACKQSGRQFPPKVRTMAVGENGMEGVLAEFPAGGNMTGDEASGVDGRGGSGGLESTGWLLDPAGGISAREAGTALAAAERPAVNILVGPEGGFTSGEGEAAIAAGYLPVRLGENVLRAETAAVAACTLALLE